MLDDYVTMCDRVFTGIGVSFDAEQLAQQAAQDDIERMWRRARRAAAQTQDRTRPWHATISAPCCMERGAPGELKVLMLARS
jgi:hypothetical protein